MLDTEIVVPLEESASVEFPEVRKTMLLEPLDSFNVSPVIMIVLLLPATTKLSPYPRVTLLLLPVIVPLEPAVLLPAGAASVKMVLLLPVTLKLVLSQVPTVPLLPLTV